MSLTVDSFSDFHRAVHGYAPFAWQSRLLEEVMSSRRWPGVLDLPTGTGKTTCIDIALFALALDSAEGAPTWCARRIAMVVDRRVVVDQIAERGRKIRRQLRESADPIVKEVARRLRSLSDPGTSGQPATTEPLGVFTLRGGVPKDDGWARSPLQPLVLASTVDQLGSRLLMQGYGVSTGMKPVHAGLLGNDILVLLDEVHLSQPFKETLEQLGELRKRPRDGHVATRFSFAFLSATPGSSSTEISFRLSSAEKDDDELIAERLGAKKLVRIESAEERTGVETACIREAKSLLDNHDVIAIVMNRVASALTVARNLREILPDSVDVVPLTGRMRPLDRDDVLRQHVGRIRTGRSRSSVIGKLVVVGTQCIEAGADFDFDAMVTESASLDALRQRFGRVDRLGKYGKAEGVIVYDKAAKDDPIYGTTIAKTMKWLTSQLEKPAKKSASKAMTVDFGVLALPVPEGERLLECLAPKEGAPVLLPAYLDLWVQSAPVPAAVPDVALWLHGSAGQLADVQVIWRADIAESDLELAAGEGVAQMVERVAAVAPSSLEAISVPFLVAQRWLGDGPSQATLGDAADLETASDRRDRRDERNPKQSQRALRWKGSASSVVDAKSLRPGDTIVVPATRGGLWEHCFDGASSHVVTDLAEKASLFGRAQPVLRTNPVITTSLGLGELPDDANARRDRLAELAATESGWRRTWLEALSRARCVDVVDSGVSRGVVLRGRRVPLERISVDDSDTVEDGTALTSDEDDSPYAGRTVSLAEHSHDVETYARMFAQGVGLTEKLVRDLALAGWLHDIGKCDRRFQIMLRGGSEIAFFRDPVAWAKSAMDPSAAAAHRHAQKRSGYPVGARHEVMSVAMLENVRDQLADKANDVELVLYLVGSHHGHCRPFAPAVGDATPVDVRLDGHRSESFGELSFPTLSSAHRLHRLDSALADRFWGCVEKYGWLELCFLESLLRLADHRASAQEQERREEAS